MSQESNLPSGPHVVLGVGLEADDEQIRAAYLGKLKEFPPDRSPVEFERVRDAYELLRDRRRRTHYKLFSCDPETPLESLLDGIGKAERRFVGPEPWLAVLKGK
ncbi:MAG: J domain-containing protein [Acidobacteriaceae bacterium]